MLPHVYSKIVKLIDFGELFEDIAIECDVRIPEVLDVYYKTYKTMPPTLTLNGYVYDFPEPDKILKNNEHVGICPNCHKNVVLPCYSCFVEASHRITLEDLTNEDSSCYNKGDMRRLQKLIELKRQR